jgi:3-oxoadipate enol-lactonase
LLVSSVPHYLDDGDGDPLVLLHSGGMAHQEWNVHREALTQRFRVLAPDLPGHGRTPLAGETRTVREMRQAVEAMLADADVDRAHVVGSSMGGAVALRLALEGPELVDRLVSFRAGYRRDTKDVVDDLRLDDPGYWRSVGMAEWLARIHEPQGGEDAWQTVVARAARLSRNDPEAHRVTREQLAEIQAPTLVVAGDRDPIVPVEEAVEMYETIPEADLWIIPHAGHVVAARTWRREPFGEEITRVLRDTRPDPEQG